MDYAFPPPPRPSLAIDGQSARFPVRRIFCVGRNYLDHVREMGNDEREPPFFFTKPADAVVESGATIPYPPQTQDLHHEIELCVLVGSGGARIAPEAVMSHLWGAAVGIDLTRRDLQTQAKRMGRPWDMGKAFDASAPIGPARPIADVPSVTSGRIWLTVNGAARQGADLADMIWSVADHVSYLSHTMRLERGDVIMTGTPAGVGPVGPGDVIAGGVAGLPDVTVTIGPAD